MKRKRSYEEVEALLDEKTQAYIKAKSYHAAKEFARIVRENNGEIDMDAIAGAFAGAIYVGVDIGAPKTDENHG